MENSRMNQKNQGCIYWNYQPMSFGQKNVKRWRREENVKEKGEKTKYNGEIEAKMVN